MGFLTMNGWAQRFAIALVAGAVAIGVDGGTTLAGDASTVLRASGPKPVVGDKGSTSAKRYRFRPVRIGGGGYVTGLAVHSVAGLSYARTDVGGAYRWDKKSQNWTQIIRAPGLSDAGPSDYQVESIAAAPSDSQTVYALVGNDTDLNAPPKGRLLSSIDGGRSWRSTPTRWFVNGNAEHRFLTERIAVDPTNSRRVLVGTRIAGLWASSDGARTFTRVPGLPDANVGEGFEQAGISSVVMLASSSEGFSAVVGVAGRGLYRTDDGAKSWNRIETPNVPDMVPLDAQLVGNTGWWSLSSSSGGRSAVIQVDLSTWTVTEITPNVESNRWALAVHPKTPSLLLASDTTRPLRSMWLSVDGGGSWRPIEESFPGAPSWLARIGFDGCVCAGSLRWDPAKSRTLWFAGGSGVWSGTVTDSAVRFDFRSDGIEETVATGALVAPDGALITAVSDFQGFRHPNVSNVPERMLTDDKFAGGTNLASSGQRTQALVWVGAEYQIYWQESRRARASRSLDGGKSWEPLPNLDRDLFGGNVAISATDPDNIVWLPSYFLSPFEYLENGKGIAVTKNGGRSWERVTPLNSNSYHRLHWWVSRQSLAADRITGGRFYLLDQNATLGVSTDGGSTWTKAAHAPPCTESNDCHVFGQLKTDERRTGMLWAAVGKGGLWRSADGGSTPWRKIRGLVDVRHVAFGAPRSPAGPNAVFVVATRRPGGPFEVLRSDDDGVSWATVTGRPAGIGATITVLQGDPKVWGRVFIGFGGLGFLQGDFAP
jgi:hypothetical protein